MIDPNSPFINVSERSILDAKSLVNWKRSKSSYNFDTLPKTVIISLNRNLLDRLSRVISKKLRGLGGQSYLLSSRVMFCSDFGNGAPALVGLLEELHALGAERFIFVGWAGALDEQMKSGELHLVNNSYSTTGCTKLYSANSNFTPRENDWYKTLRASLSLTETTCWSTDAPFRETTSLINYFIEKKAFHVDMECAAVYAFGELYKLDTLCIVITSDTVTTTGWKPPLKTVELSLKVKKMIKSLITLVNEGKL